jgi:hypothetical protein
MRRASSVAVKPSLASERTLSGPRIGQCRRIPDGGTFGSEEPELITSSVFTEIPRESPNGSATLAYYQS